MSQKISEKSLKQDLRLYKKTFRGTFTPTKYNQREKIRSSALHLLDKFKQDAVFFSPKAYKTFAEYIDTFTNFDREELLDKLQSMADFDVREELAHPKQGWLAKLLHREKTPLKYMSAAVLTKKANAYVALCKKDNYGRYSARDVKKIEKYRAEGKRYVQAIDNGELLVKEEDVHALKSYIYSVCYPIVEGSVEQSVWKKLDNGCVLQPQVAEKPRPKFSLKMKWASLKNKLKTAGIVAGVGLVGYLGIKSLGKFAFDNNKNKATTQQVAKPVTNTVKEEVKTISFQKAVVSKVKSASVSGQKIVAVKSSEKMSSVDKIWKNYYDNTIEILTSKSEKEALYKKIEQQVKSGNIVLAKDISPERLAYAHVIYQKYGLQSSLDEALNSKQKLSKEQQVRLEDEVRKAGAKGEGAKKMAQELGQNKLSSHSHFDKASTKLKKEHIKNLQQLRKLNARSNAR